MKLFVTGASGYIGGSVAVRLQQAGHQIVGLTRSADSAAKLAAAGVTPVVGNLDDADLLARHARAADGVVNAASADHRPAAEALLTALHGSGKPFIHTSGSGIVADDVGGQGPGKVYEDNTPVQPIPARAARVALNADILDAEGDGVRVVIIAPPMIYGRGLGLHVDSIQVPLMIRYARDHGGAKYVGPGENVWSNVHIEDLADLYLLALTKAPAGSFYYAENGENRTKDIAAAISRMLGFGGDASSLAPAEAIEAYGEMVARYSLGSNSRVRARRARRELGWAPRRPSLLDDIEHGSYAAAI